jgi:hypothetical protein
MVSANDLVGNPSNANSRFCLSKPGEVYLVYLPAGGSTELDLSQVQGAFKTAWFNPREGGGLRDAKAVQAGAKVSLGPPPSEESEDWLILVRR